MTRPAQVVGGAVVAMSLAVCAVVWAIAFRTPPIDRQPLPAGMVSLKSVAGSQLLAESPIISEYSEITPALESQSRAAFCGAASSVIVLNALHRSTPALTQVTLFPDAATQLRTTFGGMTLAQLGELLRANDALATVTYASETDIDAFRASARQNLQTPRDYIVVNYQRAVLGQHESGHISPLAAYDAQTDQLLILDVAAYKYPPVWVATRDLWNAMNTIDAASGRTRGFIVVESTSISTSTSKGVEAQRVKPPPPPGLSAL